MVVTIFVLFAALAAVSVALGVVANQKGGHASDDEQCVLTYGGDGAVSEAQMRRWTAQTDWLMATPRYDRATRSCVCGDIDRDPTSIPLDKPVAAWIAPGDLLDLHRRHTHGILPQSF